MIIKVSMLILLTLASFTDLRSGKIPNWLTLPAILGGLVYHVLTGGRDGFFFAGTGLILGVGLLLMPFVMGGMGGGDVKLLGAVGSISGAMTTFRIFLISAIVGLAVSIIVMIAVGDYRRALFARIARMVKRGKSSQDSLATGVTFPRISLPYGVVIASGALFSYYFFP